MGNHPGHPSHQSRSVWGAFRGPGGPRRTNIQNTLFLRGLSNIRPYRGNLRIRLAHKLTLAITEPTASKTVTLSAAATGTIVVRETASGTIALGSMADGSNKLKFTVLDDSSTHTTTLAFDEPTANAALALPAGKTGTIVVRETASGTIALGSMADGSNKVKFTALDDSSTHTTTLAFDEPTSDATIALPAGASGTVLLHSSGTVSTALTLSAALTATSTVTLGGADLVGTSPLVFGGSNTGDARAGF